MSRIEEGGRPTRLWQELIVLMVAVAVLAHSVLIALWLMPDSVIRREAGPQRLNSYVNPYFQQSWDRLDPRGQRVDETLQVRAVLIHPDTGQEITTAWADLVEAETRAYAGSLNPPRASYLARRIAVNLNLRYLSLNEPQKALVAQNYRRAPLSRLAAQLREIGYHPHRVANYMLTERMVAQYVTLFAQAHWDGRIELVQFRSGRKILPDDPEVKAEDLEFEWFEIGWRRAAEVDREALRAIEAYLAGRE